MKKILVILLLIPTFSFSQKMSCCKMSSTESFAILSNDAGFVSEHLSPLPFIFIPMSGEMTSIKCSTGEGTHAFIVKSKTASNNWLFIFHEWWGLNDYIKQEAEKIALELPNVNIMALDLYDGSIATDPETAKGLMEKTTDKRSREIINCALEYTGDKAKIATLGWCMGGGWSLQTSLIAGKKANGCVMYYGMPEQDIEKLKKLETDVLGIFALKDEWITTQVVTDFESNMKKAGKTLTVKNYETAHAFANPSNPKFDKQASSDAYTLMINYLKSKMK